MPHHRHDRAVIWQNTKIAFDAGNGYAVHALGDHEAFGRNKVKLQLVVHRNNNPYAASVAMVSALATASSIVPTI